MTIRTKRAAAEAAGWLCLLGLVIVVAAMDSGVLRPLAGGGIGLGLELIAAFSAALKSSSVPSTSHKTISII